MSTLARARLLVLAAVAAIVTVVAMAVHDVTVTADELRGGEDAVAAMLTAQLEQETGLRGFAQTGDKAFLEPHLAGRRAYEAAVARAARRHARVLRDADLAARAWQRAAEVVVEDVARDGTTAVDRRGVEHRKRLFDRFRARHDRLQAAVARNAEVEVASARRRAVLLVLGVCLGFGLLGFVVVERRLRLEQRWRRLDDEFGEALLGAATEGEAHDLLERYVARLAPGARAVVLGRSADAGLVARTELADSDPMVPQLRDAPATACLAVRRGTSHARSPGTEPLQSCSVCSAAAGPSLCLPSLVRGEVAGAVLTVGADRLDRETSRLVRQAVDRATPVLANLRTLALAEQRAATDALTGLANHRAVGTALTRMVAEAARRGTPLSAIVLDLDRFKALNDEHGHQAGDQALAAVGAVIAGTLRASDLAGRWGGEEFIVLLPATARDGAVVTAEKLRRAIAAVTLPPLPVRVTASLGVATFPHDADTAQELVAQADRAMYAAKGAGRDRVEAVPQMTTAALDGAVRP